MRLLSRRGIDFTRKFAKIAATVSKINPSAVPSAKAEASSLILDGEAVVVDNQGKPSFQMLQNWSLSAVASAKAGRLPSGVAAPKPVVAGDYPSNRR